VLVRNPGKTEVPPDILLKAAALAALYSRGRAAGKVPVTYTPARFVKKPRGAKPGLVTLSQRKTMMVRPDEARDRAAHSIQPNFLLMLFQSLIIVFTDCSRIPNIPIYPS
jgi:predicted ribosome quality control (RQC) complex YloA/Tae2 family protein